MALKIKNWERFQHFRDRKPPWIKLYRDLLDDKKWHELDSDAAKVLVSLWLVASEHDGFLPDSSELAFRLRVSKKSIESSVSKLSHWLIQDDIAPISDITAISGQHQEDIGAKALARSRETETETETDIPPSSKPSSKKKANLQPLPDDWTPSERTIQKLSDEFKFTNGDLERYVNAFRDACAAKGYTYANFDAGFSNCVRSDWPKFRKGAATMPTSAEEDWRKGML
jgi:hypothetical protein